MEVDDRFERLLRRWPESVRVLETRTDRAQTSILSVGDPGAPPVLLLPGGGATAAVWFPQAAALARDHLVIAPDLPGDVGRSTRGPGLSGPGDVADWCADVLAAAGVGSATVVAHSYGAQLAVRGALDRPDLLTGLTLLDPNGVFARIAPVAALRALPLLIAPSGRRLRRFLRWEARGAELDEAWTDLAAAGADGPRPRLVLPPRPGRAELDRLATLPDGVRVVFAQRSRYHDAARLAELVRNRYPWMAVSTVPASHHELPFVWTPTER